MQFVLRVGDPTLKNRIEELGGELGFTVSESETPTADRPALSVVPAKSSYAHRTAEGWEIGYRDRHEAFVGVRRALAGTDGAFEKKIARLAVMIDCSRNSVMRPECVKRYMLRLAAMGYNCMLLYTEDTYEVAGEPYFGHLRGGYTAADLRDLDAYAASLGVELVPCIQTLAHLDGLTAWDAYGGCFDTGNILLVGNERVYELIDRMFDAVCACFATRTVHIGMDEAWLLGAGKYLAENGFRERKDILLDHLRRVVALAKKHGIKPVMWSDMFFRAIAPDRGNYYNNEPLTDEYCASVPEEIGFVYWDYFHEREEDYARMIDRHRRFGRELWFAGNAYTCYRFSADNDLSRRTMLPAFRACVDKGVETFLVTEWADDGGDSSYYSALRVVSEIACMNYGETDEERAAAFEAVSGGYTEDDFRALDFPNDRYLFYSDPFLGKFDSATLPDERAVYRRRALQLKKVAAKGGAFSVMFDARAAYCFAMEAKYDLGLRTREAYRTGNISSVIGDYRRLIPRLEHFLALFRERWNEENRPGGLEIHEIRLGGLIRRIRFCLERLLAYRDGRIERIEELEAPVLDYFGGGVKLERKMLEIPQYYRDILSVNRI